MRAEQYANRLMYPLQWLGRIVTVAIGLSLLAACNGPTTAEGVRLYSEGKFQEARNVLQQRVPRNDPVANYFLAQMYERGDGVKADLDRALNLYMSAASRGLPQGQAALAALQVTAAQGEQLALRLQTLKDVANQHPEAGLLRLCEALLYLGIKDQETDYGSDFLACADKLKNYDDVSAARLLASAHVSGALATKDFAKGAEYASQAAAAGDAGGHALLAAAYAQGLGKPQDFSRAYIHAGTALAAGSRQMSENRRKELEQLQKRAERNLSPTALQEANKEIERLKTEAAAQLHGWEMKHRFGWAMQAAQ
ncbi:MAG: hypothetical protein ACOY3E_01640 [Pseudomonadota bacterium]